MGRVSVISAPLNRLHTARVVGTISSPFNLPLCPMWNQDPGLPWWCSGSPASARDMGLIPGPGRFHMPCHNFRAHVIQLLKPLHLDPALWNKRKHQWEACSPQLEKGSAKGKKKKKKGNKERPSAARKNNNYNKQIKPGSSSLRTDLVHYHCYISKLAAQTPTPRPQSYVLPWPTSYLLATWWHEIPFNLPVAMTRIDTYSKKHLCLSCLNGLSQNCHPWVCRLFDKLAWEYAQCDPGPRIPFSSSWSLPTQEHTTPKLPA